MGGDMDGMGDLDNAPMPPMGPDDMGMDDPNAMGGADPMGEDPNGMGGQDPNAMGGDDELMNIINGLSIEDKAAVTKYAKSMADDSNGEETPDMGGEMPMESKRNIRNLIDEVINDVLDNREGTKRPEKKLPKQYRNVEMPFKSPF
jgi:hypothetical protein